MHSFSGDHLLVFDPFGLTRVTLPNRVKHNRKVAGELLVQNGGLLIGHSVPSDRRFAAEVPSLKIIPVQDSWNYNLMYGSSLAVTPASGPFEVIDDELVVYDQAGEERFRVRHPDGKTLPGIDLGPRLVSGNTRWATRVVMGGDGRYVIFGADKLFGGKLTGSAITESWTAPVGPTQGQIVMRAGPFGAFVSAFHPALGKAICVRVRRSCAERLEVDCIAPVDFDGTHVAYQASPTEVRRMAMSGGEPERFTLPKRASGIGAVMADGERLLFLTPDHERILDLVTDDVIERGLPEAEKQARAKLLAFSAKFRGAANAANLHLRMSAMCPPVSGSRPRWAWDDGDQTLLASCVIGNLVQQSFEDRDLTAGSYSLAQALAPIDEASVRRLLEVVDEHGLGLLAGLSMCESPLETHWNPRFGGEKHPLIDKRAAQMLLGAVIETLNAKTQPKLAPSSAKWASQALTAKHLIAELDPSRDWDRGARSSCQTAVAYIVLDYLEADAKDVFLDWLVERPSGMVRSNMHIIASVVTALVAAYPETNAPMVAALAHASVSGEPCPLGR